MRTLLCVGLAALLCACATTIDEPQDLAIENVTVLDPATASIANQRTVLISDGRITAVEPARRVNYVAAETIDGTGLFLLPGLIDMHTHIDEAGLAAFPLNGVTTIRDMGTQTAPLRADLSILGAKTRVAEGRTVGPEIFTPALLLDGPVERNPRWAPHYRMVAEPEEAIALVDELAGLDVDFIKVYSALSPEVFEAIAARAAYHDLPIAGHVPDAVTIEDAIEAGLLTIEHDRGVLLAISSEEGTLREELAAAWATGDPSGGYYLRQRFTERQVASRDPAKAERLFTLMAENEVAAVPTLVVLWDPRWIDPDAAVDEDKVADFSPIYRRIVTPQGDPLGQYPSVEAAIQRFEAHKRNVREMHEAGVPILAGTDAANPFVLPGYSMHTELSLLVAAGLGEAEALNGATYLAARFLGAEDRLGRVRPGYEADLVLLKANPFESIAATEMIEHVLLNGRPYTPRELKTILEGAGGR